jgi:hypothetical protein
MTFDLKEGEWLAAYTDGGGATYATACSLQIHIFLCNCTEPRAWLL